MKFSPYSSPVPVVFAW